MGKKTHTKKKNSIFIHNLWSCHHLPVWLLLVDWLKSLTQKRIYSIYMYYLCRLFITVASVKNVTVYSTQRTDFFALVITHWLYHPQHCMQASVPIDRDLNASRPSVYLINAGVSKVLQSARIRVRLQCQNGGGGGARLTPSRSPTAVPYNDSVQSHFTCSPTNWVWPRVTWRCSFTSRSLRKVTLSP